MKTKVRWPDRVRQPSRPITIRTIAPAPKPILDPNKIYLRGGC